MIIPDPTLLEVFDFVKLKLCIDSSIGGTVHF